MAFLELLAFGFCTALLGTAAHRVATRMYPARPWSRVLAWAVLVFGGVVLILQILGATGLLRPLPAGILTVVVSGAVLLLVRRPSEVVPLRWPLGRRATFLTAWFGLVVLGVSLGKPSTQADSVWYHYPLIAHWLQVADLTTPKMFSFSGFHWFYPSNSELAQTWLVIWTRTDVFLGLSSWLATGVSVAAVTGLVRRLGGRLTTGLWVGLVWGTVPLVLDTQVRANGVDLMLSALFTLVVFFGVAWWQETGGRRVSGDLVLGGACLGLALGTKFTVVGMVAVLCVVLAGVVAFRVRRRETSLGAGVAILAVVAAGIVVPAVFWYVRNQVLVGNPFYPVGLFGMKDGFDLVGVKDLVSRLDATVPDYFFPPDGFGIGVIAALWIFVMWAGGFLVLAGLAVPLFAFWPSRTARKGDGAATAPGDGPGPSRGLLFVVCGVIPPALTAVYAAIPGSAGGLPGQPFLFAINARYGFPGFVLALVGLAVVLDRRRPRWSGRLFGAAFTLNVLFGVLLPPFIAGFGARVIPAACVLATGAVGVWLVAERILARVPRRDSKAVSYLAGTAGAVAVLAGVAASVYYAGPRVRYDNMGALSEVVYDKVRDWPAGTGVAYAGLNYVYPIYGEHLENRVELVGRRVAPGTMVSITEPAELVDFMRRRSLTYLVVKHQKAEKTKHIAGVTIRISPYQEKIIRAFDPVEDGFAAEDPRHFELVDEDKAQRISLYRFRP